MTVAFASQHTTSLPELLRQAGISLVVSTYNAGRLIVVRAPPAGGLNTHFVALTKPMGIAVGADSLAVGSGYEIREYRNMSAIAGKLQGDEPHDAAFLPRNVHITGDIDIHEMSYGDGEELWFANTRMSCLCTLDRAHSVVPRWRPPFISGYDTSDRCHLNGLAIRDGSPKFVSALGTTDTPGGWRAEKTEGGILMEVPSGEPLLENLSMPHSPRWYRDRLWFLESGRGSLSYYDPDTRTARIVAELPGFTRGLDFLDRFAFVGLSQVRESNVFAGLPLTSRVQERHCGVWVVDVESGEIVAFIQFTGGVRELFAVQIVHARFPTVLDLEDPLVRTTYSLPDAALASVSEDDPTQVALADAARERAAGNRDRATAILREILERDPDYVPALLNLGTMYAEAFAWNDARSVFEQILRSEPNHAEALHRLGQSHGGSRDWHAAIDCYDRAVATDHTFAHAYFDRGIAHCKLGQFTEGWRDLEWRRQLPGFQTLWCEQPEWNGDEVADKTILVHTEADTRDVVLFARYLPAIRQRCRRLIVLCPAELSRLFESTEGVDEVWLPPLNAKTGGFDFHCPLNSVAFHLAADPQTPVTMPYLRPPPGLTNLPDWSSSDRPRVGLAGFNGAVSEAPKDALGEWQDLFDLPCEFYSLQNTPSAEATARLRELNIAPLEVSGQNSSRPDRLAHIVAAMDLVIGYDCSATHLSAAVGTETWWVLGRNADWRWPAEGDGTPWYPTARLFHRQEGSRAAEMVRPALTEWIDHQQSRT